MPTPVVKILKKKSYLAMIRNAAKGENYMFQNLYASINGIEQDVLHNGEVSCAAFVSSVLYLQTLQKWISDVHATVLSTEKDMEKNGWVRISELREGAVITWEPITYHDGATHWHIGFYIGNDRAISNASNDSGIPREHHVTYDGARKIERIWWHPHLDEA